MFKLKNIIILILIYIITFISFKNNINIFYPYNYIRDLIFIPVKAITKENDFKNTKEYYEGRIDTLLEEINELKKLNNIKKVLSDYDEINCTVIERNHNYWFNTIKIDKGIKQGIDNDYAVITENGLIGKIINATNNFSEVKLLTTNDVNNKTSVLINNHYGIIEKFNGEYLEVTLTSKLNNIEIGEIVLTTGMGGIYPKGILIGKVIGIKEDKYDVGRIILVEPSADFNKINYVKVLKVK